MRNDGHYLPGRVLIAVNQLCVSLCVYLWAQGPEVILQLTVLVRKQVRTGDLWHCVTVKSASGEQARSERLKNNIQVPLKG